MGSRLDMDFLDRLLDYLEDNVELERPFRVGTVGSESNSISIRPTPSANLNRYVDMTGTYEYSFQITMKGNNQELVMSTLYHITEILNKLTNSDIKSNNNSFKFIKCEVDVRPNWVEETERGNHMYTAIYTAELGGI